MATENIELRDARGKIYRAKFTVDGTARIPHAVIDGMSVDVDIGKVELLLPTGFTTVAKTFGTSAEQLTATPTPVKTHPLLKADPANTGVVYIGIAGVTTGTGFALSAGDLVPVPVDDLSKIYGIGSAASQKVVAMAGT